MFTTGLEKEELCACCQKPKNLGKKGSLTQWIFQCCCDQSTEKALAEANIQVCGVCSKRLGSKVGSLTQFIFRADMCECKKSDSEQSANVDSGTLLLEKPKLEKELEVDESFPLARYAPLKKLGSGSTGAAYLAFDRLLEKRVTIKILENINDEQVIGFQREAKILNKLKNNSIAHLLNIGVSENETPYMVLEFIDGKPLEEILLEEDALDWESCLEIFIQLADILDEVHKHGIYHRDLKPSNIIVERTEDSVEASLIDFGLAASNLGSENKQFFTLAGTPFYMSPDQGKGIAYSEKSDIYSLGCVLFEALTGSKPFEGSTALETMSLHSSAEIPLVSDFCPDLPDQLQSVIDKALAKSVDERYSSVQELKEDLEQILFGSGQDSYAPELGDVPKNRSGSKLLIAIPVIAILLITLMSFLVQTDEKKVAKTIAKDSISEQPVAKDPMEPEPFLTSLNKQGYYQSKWVRVKHQVRGVDVTDSDFKLLKLAPDETTLMITGLYTKFTGSGLESIDGHPLSVFRCRSLFFNDEGTKTLSKFKTIEAVKLEQAQLSRKGIKNIASLPNLRRLSLRYMDLPRDTITVLKDAKLLDTLDLGNSKNLKSSGIEKLACLKSLKALKIAGSNFETSLVSHLVKSNQLVWLDLRNSSLTDKELRMLAELKSLQVLMVSDCKNITKAGLEYFQTRRSNCQLQI